MSVETEVLVHVVVHLGDTSKTIVKTLVKTLDTGLERRGRGLGACSGALRTEPWGWKLSHCVHRVTL